MHQPEPHALSAIVGLGFSPLSREPIGTARSLAAVAVTRAIADAGLAPSDIDGLLMCQSAAAPSASLPLKTHDDIGLDKLRLLALVEGKGASVLQMVQQATMAINSGMAETVACVFADVPVSPGQGSGSSFRNESALTGMEGWEAQYGMFGPVGAYALSLKRYMHVFGLRDADLGAYAVACRQWALHNPLAVNYKPLTLESYLQSRYIAEPLRLYDCAFPVNGAAAVIVSKVDGAEALARKPVYVHGMGQAHASVARVRPAKSSWQNEFRTAGALAAESMYGMAGISAADVTMCQFYDAFSWNVTVALEDYGLCGAGEGMRFLSAGCSAPGGQLPVNTGGGQLASYYLQGMTPLSEAVIQARGDGGARQVQRNDVIVVNGSGGTLEYHASILLSPHKALR